MLQQSRITPTTLDFSGQSADRSRVTSEVTGIDCDTTDLTVSTCAANNVPENRRIVTDMACLQLSHTKPQTELTFQGGSINFPALTHHVVAAGRIPDDEGIVVAATHTARSASSAVFCNSVQQVQQNLPLQTRNTLTYVLGAQGLQPGLPFLNLRHAMATGHTKFLQFWPKTASYLSVMVWLAAGNCADVAKMDCKRNE